MRSPFPGMDPYLEHPALWPDVHNSLIAAIRDALAPLVAPRYYVGLEQRAYALQPDDLVFIGRPDVSVVPASVAEPAAPPYTVTRDAGPIWVELPAADEVSEDYIVIHDVATGKLITAVGVALARQQDQPARAPAVPWRSARKCSPHHTNFIEVDLLRGGAPMPVMGAAVAGDYRLLVRRVWQRLRAQLCAASTCASRFRPSQSPWRVAKKSLALRLNDVLHGLYERARFDLRLDYGRPPIPALDRGRRGVGAGAGSGAARDWRLT